MAVHICARSAIRSDDAAHDDFPVLVDRLLLKPSNGRRGEGGKARADLRALGALPDDIARGAAAGDQQQRIDDNGFSRTRLPGERREPGAELEFRLVDEYQVSQLKMSQHSREPR